ncbi:medium-chain acyl-CoA ligase ACSF2, mitochondrial-like [Macrosteles quadrilineatus]|uniref:medium-chain acyl-CoA ligase ACSF2, mitochondrial-like n=1 Tax=Macrosteles quadrilineatus TaxID=74068 RepID=UPI0023E1600E|nr:medium-chain acyl-CoA ligase ACSF2, mitochondrial-like [Macrosteles quadrilineatus]
MAVRGRHILRKLLSEYKMLKRQSSSVKLSYYHQPTSEPLRYQTIGQLATTAADKWPDTEVVVSVQQSQTLTFSQAEHQANKLAAGFLELGLQPGDRLGICSPNSTQWFLTAVAAAKAGLILVSMNPSYMAHELEYCLQKVRVKALVVPKSYKTINYYKMLSEIFPELPTSPANSKLTSTKLPYFSCIIVSTDESLPGTIRFSDVADSTDSLTKLQETNQRLRPEHIGNIQFTSGTTGKPKAVPLSHFLLINNSYFCGKRLGLGEKHYKILVQPPFFHVLAYISALLGSLNFGSTLVLPSPTFNASASCEAVRRESCTMLLGTPTMYVDLCSHVSNLPADEQLLHQSPEMAVSGGALCTPELFRKMKNTFSCDRVMSVYGLTETTAMCFTSTREDSEFHMTSTVGKVSENVEAKVVDEEGLTVPFGTPGELWMRGYNMTGYWEDTVATDMTLTRDGWIKTGDRFVLGEDGYGQVVGRIKDMIIRGGENISPREVEDYLVTHPNILDAQVYGVSNERLGEEVGCSLRLTPGAKLTEQEVKDFCKDKIAYFKIPKYIEIVEDFPKTGSGKIQKYKLREAMEKKLAVK